MLFFGRDDTCCWDSPAKSMKGLCLRTALSLCGVTPVTLNATFFLAKTTSMSDLPIDTPAAGVVKIAPLLGSGTPSRKAVKSDPDPEWGCIPRLQSGRCVPPGSVLTAFLFSTLAVVLRTTVAHLNRWLGRKDTPCSTPRHRRTSLSARDWCSRWLQGW